MSHEPGVLDFLLGFAIVVVFMGGAVLFYQGLFLVLRWIARQVSGRPSSHH